MAAKSSTYYLCSECGWSGSKWYGRCPECGEWGTLSEFSEPKLQSGVSKTLRSSRNSRSAKANAIASLSLDSSVDAQPISNIQADNGIRIHTGFSEFDRVLGGGLVPGSVTLIAGEPGIGKSTLLLETAGKVAKNGGESKESIVLYISGEESKSQVKLRASRINAISQNLLLASTTDLNTALALIEKYKPTLAIVDSAQTIVSSDVDGITGGSTQVLSLIHI